MTGVVATALVAHVPTLGRAENTPDYQQTLVQAERTMGAAIREALKPDVWVIVSTHWVSTFDWFATCQAKHEGLCVAQEAPNLIPGLPYSYRGDPEFGAALVDAWKEVGVAAVRNEADNYRWDYGTFVPLQYIDPGADVAVVGVPVVLMADHGECLRAGAAVHATAKRLGRRVVFLTSTALSHLLVRGRQNWPTPERVEAAYFGNAVAARISATTRSVSNPSSSASGRSTSRCRNTGTAATFTSSGIRKSRPSRAA